MLLRELIDRLDASIAPEADGDARICDLTEDSRTVMPGSLFIARRGEKSDGRSFVPQAVAAGAVAVLTDDPELRSEEVAVVFTRDIPMTSALLAERFYDSPGSKLTLIGVTGTNGKTTVTYLIHQLLNALGIRCGLMGTVCIDDGTEIAPASLTTAPALEISRTLARMVEAGCKAAVMEVSSHALHQHRVGALRFDAAIFTNLTGDHLDYHGTMAEYAAAKRRLFSMIRERAGHTANSAPMPGLAIVNADDAESVNMLAARAGGAEPVRCRVGSVVGGQGKGRADSRGDGDVEAVIHQSTAASTRIEFRGPWGSSTVDTPLVGAFNAMNALQAAACVHGLFADDAKIGTDLSRIAGVLHHASPPPGRLEPVAGGDAPISVFVDYAHTDDALRTTLTTLRQTMRGSEKAPGSLICVFGCGGDRDRTKRPRMGRAVAEVADQIIVTSDNPRTERPESIIEEILGGIPAELRAQVIVEPDRERAIRLAIRRAQAATGERAGDVVAICGKGHEDYQILPDPTAAGRTVTRHFDDREIARSALSVRSIAVRPITASWLGAGTSSDSDGLSLSESMDATDILFESENATG